MIDNKVNDEINEVSKTLQNNILEKVRHEYEKKIPKERYTSAGEIRKITIDLCLI